MAEFPTQFVIVNDPNFKEATVTPATASVDNIKSKKTGPAVGAVSNVGDSSLFLTGTPTTNSTYEFKIQKSQDATQQGSFIWKKSSESDENWKGTPDLKQMHTVQTIEGWQGGWIKEFTYPQTIYCKNTQKEICYTTKRTSFISVVYRDYKRNSDSISNPWTTPTISIDGITSSPDGKIWYSSLNLEGTPCQVSSGRLAKYFGLDFTVCALKNGTILLAISTGGDINIYSSTDGLNFTTICKGLVSSSSLTEVQISRIEMVSSGNYVSIAIGAQKTLIFENNSIVGSFLQEMVIPSIKSFFSSNQGVTWSYRKQSEKLDIGKIDAPNWSGLNPGDIYWNTDCWCLGSLDDEGTFILWNQSTTSTTPKLIGLVASGAQPFEYVYGFDHHSTYMLKPVIINTPDRVYFISSTYFPRDENMLPEAYQINNTYASLVNFELSVGWLEKVKFTLGTDVVNLSPSGSDYGFTSFSGGGHFGFTDLNGYPNPNGGISFTALLRNSWGDTPCRSGAVPVPPVYFRMGGWETNPVRSLNYANTGIEQGQNYLQQQNYINTPIKLYEVEFQPFMGLPTGGYYSNGFLYSSEDKSPWNIVRGNSSVIWNPAYIEISDNTTGTTTGGLLYNYLSLHSYSSPSYHSPYDPSLPGAGISQYESDLAAGGITNFHVPDSGRDWDTGANAPVVDGGWGGQGMALPEANKEFPIPCWGFIPTMNGSSVTYNALSDRDKVKLSRWGSGSCLRFIVSAQNSASDTHGTGVTLYGENSPIVCGISTYLGQNLLTGGVGTTRVLNIEVRVGTRTIDLIDVRNLAGPTRIGRIDTGSDTGLLLKEWEIRVGITPWRYLGTTSNESSNPYISMIAKQLGTDQWYSTGDVYNDTDINMDYPATRILLNQMLYFGHDTVAANVTNKSRWSFVGIHAGNDLNTLSYVSPDLNPVANLKSYSRNFGGPLSPFPIGIEKNLSTVWGGSTGAVGDQFNMEVDHNYALTNMLKFNSPRVFFESTDANSFTDFEFVVSSKENTVMYLNHFASTNCRAKKLEFSYSNDGITYSSPVDTLDFGTIITGSVQEVRNNILRIRWDATDAYYGTPIHKILRDGLLTSSSKRNWYLYKDSVGSVGTTWELKVAYDIVREYKIGQVNRSGILLHESDIEISTKNAASYYPISAATCLIPSYAVGSSIRIYSDRGMKELDTSLTPSPLGAKYVKVVATPFERADNNSIRIGTMIGGIKKEFKPPLNWDWSDVETPNEEQMTTRSGIKWTNTQGPSSRALSLKMEGDLSEQFRYGFRKTLDGITQYSKNPMFISLAPMSTIGTIPNRSLYEENLSLVQFDSSSDFKNQGWKYNENTSEWIAIGNMGFKFSEIV